MRIITGAIFLAVSIVVGSSAAWAQGAEIPFGGLAHDSSLPVEIAADNLQIDQTNGTVVFIGNVTIGQGEMRISARRVEVEYEGGSADVTAKIERLHASGDVLLVNGAEAASAERADYSIDSGEIVMNGNVVMTQGENALAANRMVVNLDSGTAQMSGRVRTILQSGEN